MECPLLHVVQDLSHIVPSRLEYSLVGCLFAVSCAVQVHLSHIVLCVNFVRAFPVKLSLCWHQLFVSSNVLCSHKPEVTVLTPKIAVP